MPLPLSPPFPLLRLTHTLRCVKGNEKFLAKFPSSLIGLWGIWLLPLPPPHFLQPATLLTQTTANAVSYYFFNTLTEEYDEE